MRNNYYGLGEHRYALLEVEMTAISREDKDDLKFVGVAIDLPKGMRRQAAFATVERAIMTASMKRIIPRPSVVIRDENAVLVGWAAQSQSSDAWIQREANSRADAIRTNLISAVESGGARA